MQQKTTLRDHLKNEDLARLNNAWHQLTPLQKKCIVLQAFITSLPRRLLETLHRHIEIRRSRFAYLYQAHWVGV